MKKLACLLAILLAGCANSPLQISLKPSANVAPENIGMGRPIMVSATDARADKSLGSLGGVYADTSSVTIKNSVSQALEEELSRGFELWGFSEGSGSGQVQVHAELVKLGYHSPDKVYTSNIDKECEVRVQVRIGGATYNGNYRSSGDERLLVAPSAAKVQHSINELLSSTLTNVFADEKLQAFLLEHR